MFSRKWRPVDAVDKSDMTPLHWSTMNLQGHMNNLLLEYGADIHATTKQGSSVIECIPYKFATCEVRNLLRNGAPYPRSAQYKELIDEAVEQDLSFSSEFYKKYVKALITNKTEETITLLKEAKGNDLNESSVGLTPLHWAVIRGNKQVVTALTTLRAQENSSSNKLSYIAQALPIVSSYIKKPIIIDVQDNQRRTPLIWASRLGYTSIYDELMQSGANQTIRDRYGKNALDYRKQ